MLNRARPNISIALRILNRLRERTYSHLGADPVIEGGYTNYFFITALKCPILGLLVEGPLVPEVERSYEVLELFITLSKMIPI